MYLIDILVCGKEKNVQILEVTSKGNNALVLKN